MERPPEHVCMTIAIEDVMFELDSCTRGPLTQQAYSTAPGGSFGKVLLGWWRDMRVAVKILASNGDPAHVAHKAFMSEVENMVAVRTVIERARTLERIGAPLVEPCDLVPARRCREDHDLRGWRNVACVYGVGTVPDLGVIAPGLPTGPAHLVIMEPLTGGSLVSLPRTLETVARAPADISAGLAALAAAHVVHADIKPENILIRAPSGLLVLTDYGLSRISNGGADEPEYAHDAPPKGSWFYLAPELLGGRLTNTFASDMCVSWDIYAFAYFVRWRSSDILFSLHYIFSDMRLRWCCGAFTQGVLKRGIRRRDKLLA